MMLLVVLVCSFSLQYVQPLPEVVVNLPLGRLAGDVVTLPSGRAINSFEGIPYAEPPVGPNRFKAPIPVKPWVGTWIARNLHKCLELRQIYTAGEDPVTGLEDCLYLNVYTPNLRGNLDVIVFIHGGAWMFGDPGSLRPDYILNDNVILITMNYRLGPFGFLSTEDDTIPSNNGLRDQTLALQWVQKYIRYFGGNPGSVTITGMSAGGASVHYHYLMPQSRNLFHRGISQCGTAFNAWTLTEAPLQKARKLGSLQGCPTNSRRDMVDCLRTRPGRALVESSKAFQLWRYYPFSPYGPVIDKWSSDPTLPDHPYNLIKTRRVADRPWLTSLTNAEGTYPARDFYDDELLRQLNVGWLDIAPALLDYNYTVRADLQDSVSQRIRNFYFGNRAISKATFVEMISLLSNRHFVLDIEAATKLQASVSKSPVYSYYFSYRGAYSFSPENIDFGAAHGDDTSYVLALWFNATTTPNDKRMSDIMVKIFTTFARTGVPDINVPWRPLSKNLDDPFNYLAIENVTRIYPAHTRSLGDYAFWNSLPIIENAKWAK